MLIEMNKAMQYLEQKHAMEILTTLSQSDRMFFSELKEKIPTGGITTINSRIENLKEINLVLDKHEKKTDRGRRVGIKRYIWLTNTGKLVAEKIKELEKIVKE